MAKHMSPMSLGAALTVAVLLAGCAGAPTVYWENVGSAYSPGILGYSSTKGGMLTEVIGNPFAAPKSELDAAIVETAQNSHFGQKVPFFTQAPEGYNSPYKVVYIMNPVVGAGGFELCQGKVETRQRAPSEPDRVLATLCSGDVNISTASGGVPGPLGPRDPAFLALISDLTYALFPPGRPDDREDNRRFFLITGGKS